MSETKNPLFDSERELLERQKEEYKNALMGDVNQIKSQGQQIGKKVAIAGGILVAGLLIRSMFGGSKKKSKKLKRNEEASLKGSYYTPSAGRVQYDSLIHEQEDDYTLASERMNYTLAERGHPTGRAQGFMKSEMAQMLTQQLTTLLLLYMTKKVEEYLNSVSKNSDIAAAPIEVTEIETIEYTVPQEDAV
ncbi:hypothetical protein [Pontibacter roseus]|uniref:hypothetical protein n=1 Tax=Pontibacter roseus TaxID=336989 RepID=UPI00037E497C|nr:hypothetical protein [Pontibacter roseus]